MTKRAELVGQQFGKLTVISFLKNHEIRKSAIWLCRCSCPEQNEIEVGTTKLKSGHTKSCGCLQQEISKQKAMGNTWGRINNDPKLSSARRIWKYKYRDGNLSFDKFLELSQQPCFYCGIEQNNCYNVYITKNGKLKNSQISLDWAKGADFKYNGLDRVDSSRKHDEDNVVPCCIRCNFAKNDATISDFQNWVIKAYNFFIITKGGQI